MQADLDRNLHHNPAEYERGVHDRPVLRKRPIAKQTQRLHYMMIVLTLDRLPNQIHQRILQAVQQPWIAFVVTRPDTDNGPEEQLVVFRKDFLGLAQRIEER